MRGILIFLFLFLISGNFNFAEASEPNDQYGEATLVLYNQNVADSRKLAAHYSKVRNIPFSNLVGFKCPTSEIISRSDYEKLIMTPLKDLFQKNHWWESSKAKGSEKISSYGRIKFVAIMYGMPLKILSDPVRRKSGNSGTIRGHGNNDASSVDSEIACLGIKLKKLNGAISNPYFRSSKAGGSSKSLLVSRIDGPDFENAKRLIDDAIAVEETGLWGNAVLDIANLAQEKGQAYITGDRWLKNCGDFYQRAGIPVIYDRFSSLIPGGFPLGDDVILYFGWYAANAQGPFANTKFKFKRGAIAAHIHSYSASTLRTTLKHWSGPLVARGACAVLGNVYEPLLQMTTYLDIFNARLLAGFTFAESAWIATPVLSWMQVMIGDPLYQPFKSNVRISKDIDYGYKAFKMSVLSWAEDGDKLKTQFELVSKEINDGSMLEFAGLHFMSNKEYASAIHFFTKALKIYSDSTDLLRVKIHLAYSLTYQGNKKESLRMLDKLSKEYEDSVKGDALNLIIKNIKTVK